MRNKNSLLSLVILALILVLGVGYAVVSSVYVNIGGTANAAGADLNVEITDAVAVTNISEKTVDFNNVLSDINLTYNFTINNMTLGEIVTITYTVTNNETDVDAVLSLASGVTLNNSNPDYFRVDYDITDATTDLENNDKTMTVVVTVELIKTPVTEENSSTTVGLTLTASPAGSDSSSGSSDVQNGDVSFIYSFIESGEEGTIIFSNVGNRITMTIQDKFFEIQEMVPGTREEIIEIYQYTDIEGVYDPHEPKWVGEGTSITNITKNIPELAATFDYMGDGYYHFEMGPFGIDIAIQKVENTVATPLKFGEKYRLVSFIGFDVRNSDSWIMFHEDGHFEHSSNLSNDVKEGYTYSNTNIMHPTFAQNESITISSDGKYLNHYQDSAIIATYVLESEYITYISAVPLKFNEEYICTTDNVNDEESSMIGGRFSLYPDGSGVTQYPDGQIEHVPTGTYIYSQNEIQSSFLPEETKMIISEDGNSITVTYSGQVMYIYTHQS